VGLSEGGQRVKLAQFELGHEVLSTEYVETLEIRPGVVCYSHRFVNDRARDLAIVHVLAGHSTPLQRVLSGEETLEGFVSGRGILTVIAVDETVAVYAYPGCELHAVSVSRGELMQWQADSIVDLVFFEVCAPPYTQGRFEDL
jgi:hypothetical protein